MEYYSGWREATQHCPSCGWTGTGDEADQELFDGLIQVDCARCDTRLFLVPYPTHAETRLAASQGNQEAQMELRVIKLREGFLSRYEASLLTNADKLPDIPGDRLDFFLTTVNESWHVLAAGDPPLEGPNDPRIIHKELAAYETIEPVTRLVPLLEQRYGDRFRYLRTNGAELYLLGDDLSASSRLERALGKHLAASQAEVDAGSKAGSASRTEQDPWVADLHTSTGHDECQSTVGFDDFACTVSPQWYVQLETLGYQVANSRWEGKLCNACLTGWLAWATEEPDAVRLITVNPILSD